MSRKMALTMIETLAVIILLALLIVLLTSRIGGSLEKPKDLGVMRDIEQYKYSANILTNLKEDFTSENLNKHISSELKITETNLSNVKNPYKRHYQIEIADKDNFTVKSLKNSVTEGQVIKTFKFSKTSGKLVVTESSSNGKVNAVIEMTPDQGILIGTSITWSASISEGVITEEEWVGKEDSYSEEGLKKVKLRVKDDKGKWTDWVEKEFYVLENVGVKQIVAGAQHTLAILEDGTVKAWGANDRGQLGDGTFEDKSTPITVSGITNAVQVVSGSNTSAVLLEDGTVKAWGYNYYGQVGNGTIKNNINSPVTVVGLNNVIQIDAGMSHMVALLEDGTVKAWGNNVDGEFGDGTDVSKSTPTPIPGLTNVKQIIAGDIQTVALLEDGTVMSWGSSAMESLGYETTVDVLSPIIVSGLSNVKQIAIGLWHTLALLEDGTVKAWGFNEDGELGDGTVVNKITPVTIPGLSNVKQVDAGDYHSAALLNDGTVKTWGYNAYGQLGDGTDVDRLTPVEVPGLSGVKQISIGEYHSTALLNDKTVVTWGCNEGGQLGNGTKEDSLTPVTTVKLN